MVYSIRREKKRGRLCRRGKKSESTFSSGLVRGERSSLIPNKRNCYGSCTVYGEKKGKGKKKKYAYLLQSRSEKREKVILLKIGKGGTIRCCFMRATWGEEGREEKKSVVNNYLTKKKKKKNPKKEHHPRRTSRTQTQKKSRKWRKRGPKGHGGEGKKKKGKRGGGNAFSQKRRRMTGKKKKRRKFSLYGRGKRKKKVFQGACSVKGRVKKKKTGVERGSEKKKKSNFSCGGGRTRGDDFFPRERAGGKSCPSL